MQVDEKLVQSAVDFVRSRFPEDQEWAGAAAMYLDDGTVVISTAPDVHNTSTQLCHEVGCICEAFKLNRRVTATVCVSRDPEGKFRILTPCGICQERLMFWGSAITAAVPKTNDPTSWEVRTLAEIQPFYWRKQFEMGEQ